MVDKSGLGKLTLSGAAGSFAPIVFDVIEGPAAAASTHVFGSQMIAHVGSEGGLDLSADQAIALLDNYGIVALRADLTTSGPVMNNGLIGVIGSTDGNGTETMAATRTIVTAGFNGGSTGLVQLGGLTGNTANSLVIDQSGNSNYAGSFTGAGSLTKTGSGTLTLTGASNFTGGLAINGGTLDTTGGGTLADTLAVTVGAAGTYTVGTADIIGALTNGGHVTRPTASYSGNPCSCSIRAIMRPIGAGSIASRCNLRSSSSVRRLRINASRDQSANSLK